MDYIFLGGLFPHERLEEIRNQGDNSVGIAANALQWSLLSGLDIYLPNLKVITAPYISSYPRKNNILFFEKSSFSHKNNSRDICIGFINLPYLKVISRYFSLRKILRKNIDKNKKTVIFIYGIHSPFLLSVTNLIKKNKNIKTCLIVPDIPQFNFKEGSAAIYRFLKKIDIRIINKAIGQIDSFVLLSRYMKEPLKINLRPWTLVEGIYNLNDDIETNHYDDEIKRVLYAGSLHRRNNIMTLITAFAKLKNEKYKLIICGDGDLRKDIENVASKDERIIYKGLVNREHVLELQKKCDLLVNPRTAEGEYTKYSFPSKTMEYLASGTPTLLYKLPGIPDEYYNYCYTLDKEGVDALFESIDKILEKPKEELRSFGFKARNFILKNKNPEVQCAKIFNLINQL